MSCAHALSAELRISAQRNQIRLRQIMDGKLATKRLSAQVPALDICYLLNAAGELYSSRNELHAARNVLLRFSAKCYFLTALDQFDLVPFGSVNEGNSTAVR